MKLSLIVAVLFTPLGGMAHAQVPAPIPAAAQPSAACSPAAFAKGQCDSIEAASPAPAPQGLTLSPSLQTGLGTTLHIDSAGQQAFEQTAAELRQQAATPLPGGVPSIRAQGRPAVVVPLLSF